MSWQTIYWLPSVVSGIISAGLAMYLWKHRRVPLTRTMIWLLAFLAEWSLTYALEIHAITFEGKLFWSRLQWFGVLAAAPLWFVVALKFSGRDHWLTRRNNAILILVPAVTLVLAQTTEYHHLIWSRFWVDHTGPVPMLTMDRSLGYWLLFVAVSYVLVFFGTVILIGAFLRTRHLYRRQTAVLLVGVSVPWIGNILFNIGLSPLPRLDLTPSAFTASGLVVALGLFRWRLLDIVPVAREAVIESMGDAVMVIDRRNRIVDLNASALRLIGLPAPEIIGRWAGDLFRDYPAFKERYLDVSSEVHEEAQLGGSLYDLKISLLMHPSGGQIGRLVVLRDVTSRKRAEDALRESEERYRTLIEASMEPIVVYDAQNHPLYVNPAFTGIFGWSLEELRERPADFVPEDLRTTQRAINKRILEGEKFHRVESRRLNRSGELLDVSVSAARFQDRRGTPVGRVESLRNVSDRKRMEKALRETSGFLQDMIDSMPSILIGVDGEGRVTQWNAQALRLTGYASPDAVGQPLPAVFPWLALRMDQVTDCIRRKQSRTVEKLTFFTEGLTRYYNLVIYPLSAGDRDGAVIRMDDVTESTRIEEIMVQTEKMMSVGGLAAGMAHEINNPLGGIIQGVQNIQRRLSPNMEANRPVSRECGIDLERVGEYLARRKIQHLLDGVLSSGKRAARIVTNMLEFSRQSGSERIPVRIEALLDKTIELAGSDYDLKKQFDFRHIEISRDYDPDLPAVPCEVSKIEQVLLNLLKNAAQALGSARETTEPAPRITVRTRRSGDEALIEIADNGPGMTEEVRRRAFEPFFTTKPVGAGTGLGLSVSYFIITQNHRGSMSVESTPGMGAKFIIRLPLTDGG